MIKFSGLENETDTYNARIYNSSGAIEKSFTFRGEDSVDISGLSSGTKVVNIITPDGRMSVVKFMKL